MKNLITFALIIISCTLFAQTDMQFLEEAQTFAKEEKYNQAFQQIDNGLRKFPGHYDLLTYKVRLLLWDGHYEQASELVNEVLQMYPDAVEVWELKLTSFLWQQDWVNLSLTADEALRLFPENRAFHLKKVKALIGLKEYESAKLYLKRIRNEPVHQTLQDQLLLSSHDFVRASGRYARFSGGNTAFTPWTLTSASYGHTGKHSWDVTATYGELFDQSGLRFNLNAYPTLTPKLTAFVEAGYSPSGIFPNAELGVELTKAFGSFDVSGGVKYFRFMDEGNVFLYKGGAGYYFGKNYASYRIFYTDVLGNPSYTHLVTLRHFFSSKYNYLQLQGSLGSTPVEINSLREVQRLDARLILLSYKHLFDNKKWILDTGVGFQKEGYQEAQSRKRLNLQIGITRLWD